jgi:hypothetical protein
LSIRENRVAYDLIRKKNPDLYRPASEQRDLDETRDKSGNIQKGRAERGSYAEHRLA